MITHWCSKCGGLVEGWGNENTAFCTCQKVQTGWECPKCHNIHSPTVLKCDCSPYQYQTTTYGNTDKMVLPKV